MLRVMKSSGIVVRDVVKTFRVERWFFKCLFLFTVVSIDRLLGSFDSLTTWRSLRRRWPMSNCHCFKLSSATKVSKKKSRWKTLRRFWCRNIAWSLSRAPDG